MSNMSVKSGKNYCEDCKWETHGFIQAEYPRCKNPSYRSEKCWSRRETIQERYPFCSHINRNGYCSDFVERTPTLGSNIITIWKSMFKGSRRNE
jgi:hypothetical protein